MGMERMALALLGTKRSWIRDVFQQCKLRSMSCETLRVDWDAVSYFGAGINPWIHGTQGSCQTSTDLPSPMR